MEIKEKVLESCNQEWQTCGAIAKKTELYPEATKTILLELLAENKIEKMQFNKRTKFRKPTPVIASGSAETPLQSTIPEVTHDIELKGGMS